MADIRINALATTATTPASDDYLALDGAAQGTRKILATNIANNVTDVILGSSGPSVKSSLSARAPRQGLVFDGTSQATVANGQVIGTGDFTIAAWVLRSGSNLSVPIWGNAGSIGCAIRASTITLDKPGTGTVVTWNYTVASDKFVFVTIKRSGTTATAYVDGVSIGDVSSVSTDFTTAFSTVGLTTFSIGSIIGPLIYNRGLSASEVVRLYEAGAPAGADYNNASSTSTVTGDSSTFTSGLGSWSAWGAGTITASAGVGNVTSGATTDNGDYLAAQLPQSPAAFTNLNKRYRITLTLGSVTGGTVIVRNLVGGGTRYATGLTSGTHIIDTGLITGQQNFGLAASAAGVTFTVDNITVVPLGLLLAPDAAQAGGGLVWYDTSGNAANITLPASGVTWNVPSSLILGGKWTVATPPDTTGMFNLLPSGGDYFALTLNNRSSGAAAASRRWIIGNNWNNNGDLSFLQSTSSTSTSYNTMGTFAASGNFLIGTTTDGGQKLQVNGDATFAGKAYINGATASSALDARISTGTTNDTVAASSLSAISTGTATDGFGGRLNFLAKDLAGNESGMASIRWAVKNTGYSNREGELSLWTFSNGVAYRQLTLSPGPGTAGTSTFVGPIAIGNTVNTVSPTSPNRTITMVIGGTTYYIHAKTTND